MYTGIYRRTYQLFADGIIRYTTYSLKCTLCIVQCIHMREFVWENFFILHCKLQGNNPRLNVSPPPPLLPHEKQSTAYVCKQCIKEIVFIFQRGIILSAHEYKHSRLWRNCNVAQFRFHGSFDCENHAHASNAFHMRSKLFCQYVYANAVPSVLRVNISKL